MSSPEFKVVVAIIDSEKQRREELANSLSSIAVVQQAFRDPVNLEISRNEVDGTHLANLGPVLVCLRHFGDASIDKDITARATIYYGGSGGVDDRAPSADVLRIWRPVHPSGRGALNKSEASELIKWIVEGCQDPRPQFLNPSIERPILTALAILCQGYLSTYAAEDGTPDLPRDSQDYGVCAEALRKMGWLEFQKYNSTKKLIDLVEVSRKRSEVKRLAWWTTVFEQIRPDNEEIKVEAGIKPSKNIEILLDVVFSKEPTSSVEPPLVANAYVEIVEILR